MSAPEQYLTIKEAAAWASKHLSKRVTENNISYLIQYGRIGQHRIEGVMKVSRRELLTYYQEHSNTKHARWTQRLGDDINWALSFDHIKEADRTKHVHRLHQYKGKFIPQLVEYFLDSHTDEYKTQVFFHENDIILDPFAGSGTTLVQSLELGLHSIGIDISKFNCIISQVKIQHYNIPKLKSELYKASRLTQKYSKGRYDDPREDHITDILNTFNKRYYPTLTFRRLINNINRLQQRITRHLQQSATDEQNKILEKYKKDVLSFNNDITKFLKQTGILLDFHFEMPPTVSLRNEFVKQYSAVTLTKLRERLDNEVEKNRRPLTLSNNKPITETLDQPFISKWFTPRQQRELGYYLSLIKQQKELAIQDVMKIVLSRTARSCRATTHSDLATLISPQYTPYYCRKHFKICRPIYTIVRHLNRYTRDTVKRINTFSELRRPVHSVILNADSKNINIFKGISEQNDAFYNLLKEQKISGVFTSPPYLGQIDYHEQHAYAYELFDIERKDELEIGSMSNGKSQRAKKEYIDGISQVLKNISRFLSENAHMFLVANDKQNIYPEIAEQSDLKIIDIFRRPVLNRTERDKQPYSESIFHMKLP